MEFNITEEVAALIAMKGTSTGADLYEEARKVLKCVSTPIQKLDEMMTDGEFPLPGIKLRSPSP
jgi:hypothetical protein